MLSIANYNMHCGMDGWGRPFDYVAAIAALDADVIVLEEAWTVRGRRQRRPGGRGGPASGVPDCGAHARLGAAHPAAAGGGGRHLAARPDLEEREQGAVHGRRAAGVGPRPGLARWQQAEQGSWGIAVLVRPSLPIEATQVAADAHAAGRPCERAALVVDVTVEGRPISVAGTHMSHLHMGSYRNWAELRRQLRTEARPDAVLAGDMNSWGPLVQPVHAGLAAGGHRPDLADLASAQPDRPHSGPGCPAARGGSRLPACGLGPPPATG